MGVFTFWARGVNIYRVRNTRYTFRLVLSIAAVKDGYSTQRVTKQIATLRRKLPWPPRDVNLTIPLRSLVPVSAPVRRQQQQQQQQQQQTVVVPVTKDEKKKTGTVMVSCSVEDAEVYVDGVFVGNAPANLKLNEGIHIIEVKKSGYSSYRKELRVFADSDVSLRAKLTK